jgi:hypothetical protein
MTNLIRINKTYTSEREAAAASPIGLAEKCGPIWLFGPGAWSEGEWCPLALNPEIADIPVPSRYRFPATPRRAMLATRAAEIAARWSTSPARLRRLRNGLHKCLPGARYLGPLAVAKVHYALATVDWYLARDWRAQTDAEMRCRLWGRELAAI